MILYISSRQIHYNDQDVTLPLKLFYVIKKKLKRGSSAGTGGRYKTVLQNKYIVSYELLTWALPLL